MYYDEEIFTGKDKLKKRVEENGLSLWNLKDFFISYLKGINKSDLGRYKYFFNSFRNDIDDIFSFLDADDTNKFYWRYTPQEELFFQEKLFNYIQTLSCKEVDGKIVYDKEKLQNFKVEDIFEAYEKTFDYLISNLDKGKDEILTDITRDILEHGKSEIEEVKKHINIEFIESVKDVLINLVEQEEEWFDYFSADAKGKEAVLKSVCLNLENPLELNLFNDIELDECSDIILRNENIYYKYFDLSVLEKYNYRYEETEMER